MATSDRDEGAHVGSTPAFAAVAVPKLRRLASELRRERRALDRVMVEVRAARSLLATRAPTHLELRGAADLLHDFYTGCEKAFELVATTLDGGPPEGASWHRRLLETMGLEVAAVRPAVIRSETAHTLDEYLRFRHLFRSLYGFELLWERVAPLLDGLEPAYALVAGDLDGFVSAIEAIAS